MYLPNAGCLLSMIKYQSTRPSPIARRTLHIHIHKHKHKHKHECVHLFLLLVLRSFRAVSLSRVFTCLHGVACWLSYLAQLLLFAFCFLVCSMDQSAATSAHSYPPILLSFVWPFFVSDCIRVKQVEIPRSRDPPSSFSVSTPTAFYTKTPLCPHAETCTFASRMSTHTRCRRLISDVRFMISEF